MANNKKRKERAKLRNAQRHHAHPEREWAPDSMSLEELIEKKGSMEEEIKTSSKGVDYGGRACHKNPEMQQRLRMLQILIKEAEERINAILNKMAEDFAESFRNGGPDTATINGQQIRGWADKNHNTIHVIIEPHKTYSYPIDITKPMTRTAVYWDGEWW